MIQDYYLFSKLNKDEAELIEKRLFLKPYDKNTLIFQEDDSIDAIYFIVEGEVEIYRRIKGNKTQKIMKLKKGDFFGEVGIFYDNKRFVNAKASEDLQLLVLLKSDFLRLIKDNKEIKYKIYKAFLDEMVMRLRLSDDKFREFFKEVLKDN